MKTKLRPHNDGYGGMHTVRIPLWPYLVTPLAVIAALPLTWGAHRLYGGAQAGAGWTGVVLTLAGLALLAFVAWASRPRGRVMQVMAISNTLLGVFWVIPAVLDGPISKGMIGLWAIGGLLMSLIVAVYRIMRQARGDMESVIRSELGEFGEAVKQLKDVRLGRPQISGAKVSAAVTMPPGRTFAEVPKPELASLLDVSVTGVRKIQNPDSERRGVLEVVPVDQLRESVPWAGPSAPGESIAQPIRLGVMEDGEPLQLWLPGDPSQPRNAVGVLGVVGMSGSGKTELLLNLCCEVLTRCDTEFRLADARKGEQLPQWTRKHAAQAAIGPADAEALLEDMPAEVERRAKWLGQRGYKQWEPGCGLDYVVVLVFEAAAVVAGNGDIIGLAESVRSVGICLVLELQRATWDRLPTSARSNIAAWICLGVQSQDDAEAALTDEAMAAGAAPWRWKNNRPGYAYIEAPGLDPQRAAIPGRGYAADDADRAAAVEAVRGAVPPSPAPPTPAGGEAPSADQDRPEERNRAVNADEPPDDVDPSKPIRVPPGMPRIPLGDPPRPMTPAEAREVLRQYIYDLNDAGQDTVRPDQLGDVLANTGRSGSWLYKELRALCRGEDALLRSTERGVYRISIPQPV